MRDHAIASRGLISVGLSTRLEDVVIPVSRKLSKYLSELSADAQQRLTYFNQRRDEIVSTIRELVEI
jgi:hypothetical protein